MRNKGFTLIELLAVIVILAIIALIAVPIVLGIIENSRNEANERSIEMYAKAVKNGLATYQLYNDDEVAVGTYSSKTLPFKVSYDGDVECDTIKIRENKKLTLSNCKVNGEDVNYIYGHLTLGDHIISSNGGYSKAIDLKGEKKIVETSEYLASELLGESITLYFSDEIEINYEKGTFKLVGNIRQLSISYWYINDCNSDSSCSYGKYGASSIESSYVYKNFNSDSTNSMLHLLSATKMEFGYEYNSSSGTGLYKTEDSSGDSYYFRGDVKNNYVKLSGKEIVHYEAIKEEAYTPIDVVDALTLCGEDQECLQGAELYLSVYSKIIFANKEMCEEIGNSEGIWTTCQVSNLKDVYHIDEDEPIFFKTEQECVDSYNVMGAEITSCEKYTLKNKDAHDEIVYNDSYYRIVRINGDGTIRLIYDGDSLVENGKEHIIGNFSYENDIAKYSLDKYIAETDFLNDSGQSITTFYDSGWDGYWENWYYNGYNKTNPNLLKGTTSKAKIGSLSATEAALAGALGPITNNYLSGSSFKTSTLSSGESYVDTCEECTFSSSHGCHSWETYSCQKEKKYYYVVAKDGSLTTAETGETRPVINLIADVPFTGTGTIDDPYVIKSY